jgi:Zn-dependent protease with chaperone function
MILPYLSRLAILALALFFLVQIFMSGAVSLLAPLVIRRLPRNKPAANLLFFFRLLPTGLALLAVVVLGVPSYLELEPDATMERVGWVSLVAALLGTAMWSVSILRTWRAVRSSSRWVRNCERAGLATALPGTSLPILVVENPSPIFVLAGILRPRLIVSQEVLDTLSSAQLTAVLRHEDGHRAAHDNLKRLLTLIAPVSSTVLDRTWANQAEWAADDSGADRLHLAEALVGVARIGAMPASPRMFSSLMAEERDLTARVERLLESPAAGMHAARWTPRLIGMAATVTLLTAVALLYAALPAVHDALEYLLR